MNPKHIRTCDEYGHGRGREVLGSFGIRIRTGIAVSGHYRPGRKDNIWIENSAAKAVEYAHQGGEVKQKPCERAPSGAQPWEMPWRHPSVARRRRRGAKNGGLLPRRPSQRYSVTWTYQAGSEDEASVVLRGESLGTADVGRAVVERVVSALPYACQRERLPRPRIQ